MSFLRSVIADARPRKSMLESSDAPAFQADNPVNQDIQDMASNVEPTSPLSVIANESRLISDEESYARLDTGDPSNREPDSEGDKASKAEGSMTPQPSGTVIPDSSMNSPKGQDRDPFIASPETHGARNRASGHEEIEPLSSPARIRDTPGKELTDIDGNSTLQAEEGAGQLGVQQTMSSTAEENAPAQGEVAGVTAADGRQHLASVPQSADRKVSTSAISPDLGSSKPSSPVQHIARPARPSASPEVLRSVPARLFQTDLMPKDGDSFHSRAPLRYPEKKHEAPKVQIGQIDVIIEAPAQSATKPAPPPLPIDLSSRHYLRRL